MDKILIYMLLRFIIFSLQAWTSLMLLVPYTITKQHGHFCIANNTNHVFKHLIIISVISVSSGHL